MKWLHACYLALTIWLVTGAYNLYDWIVIYLAICNIFFLVQNTDNLLSYCYATRVLVWPGHQRWSNEDERVGKREFEREFSLISCASVKREHKLYDSWHGYLLSVNELELLPTPIKIWTSLKLMLAQESRWDLQLRVLKVHKQPFEILHICGVKFSTFQEEMQHIFLGKNFIFMIFLVVKDAGTDVI